MLFSEPAKDQRKAEQMRNLSIVEHEKEENSKPEIQRELINEEIPRVNEYSAVKDDDDEWEDIELACKTSKLGLQDLFISVHAVGTDEIPKNQIILVKVRQFVGSILTRVEAE